MIKIDRIASERIQPSTLNAPMSQVISPNSSNLMLQPTTTTSLSMPIRQRQDATLFLDHSNEENNFDNLNSQILQLQLKTSNSVPIPYVISGNQLSSTIFSSQLQPSQPNTKTYDPTISYNNGLSSKRNSVSNEKLRTNTINNDQTNTTFSSENTTVQNISVDSNALTMDIEINKIIDPPGYGNYINQVK